MIHAMILTTVIGGEEFSSGHLVSFFDDLTGASFLQPDSSCEQ